MRVFITGCTGYVGRHLAKHLLENGHQIRALVRKSSDAKRVKDLGIEVCVGDVTEPNTLYQIAEDIDVVFHLACIFLGPDYEKVVVEGTKNVINAFKDSRIKSFVFSSFSPVYGDATKELFFRENMVCHPTFKEAQCKLQAEEQLLKAYRNYGFPAVVLRIPSIYGGIQSHFETIFIDRIKSGKMVIFGRGNNKNSYVHIDDVVRALILAATNENAVGEVFNIAGGDAATVNELCSLISKEVESKMPKHIPIWAAYIISGIASLSARLQGKRSPLPISLIKLLILNGVLDIGKSNKILGYNPKYKKTLEGVRQSHFTRERYDENQERKT